MFPDSNSFATCHSYIELNSLNETLRWAIFGSMGLVGDNGSYPSVARETARSAPIVRERKLPKRFSKKLQEKGNCGESRVETKRFLQKYCPMIPNKSYCHSRRTKCLRKLLVIVSNLATARSRINFSAAYYTAKRFRFAARNTTSICAETPWPSRVFSYLFPFVFRCASSSREISSSS